MELKNKLVPKGQGKAPVQAGFTLIEIMIALAILAVGVLGLYTAQGNSLKASGTAEEVQIASTLAQQKMAEKMLEIEKDLQKGTLPEDKTEETGEFERPFQRYRWQYLVRQVDLPLAGGSGAEVAGDNAAPESAQRSAAQIVTKKISESLREVKIKVIWENLGQEQSVTVTTHVARL